MTSAYRIPFNRAAIEGDELLYIAQSVASGHISGDGPFTRKCHEFLERHLGVPKTLLTSSCTHALEMSALLLDVKPGDEVIVPSFTFVSTVNAFLLRGARPIFIDIRPDTLNLDEALLDRLVSARTKAIVAVHYAGVGCEMDTIVEIAERSGVAVVEDNAHGLFGTYRSRFLGTIASMATQSFHETKNFTCGEGGALLINDPRYIARAEILREKGTNRSRFFRGEVDKYTWVDLGSSYLPSDISAAFLYAQLEARERIQSKRQRIWNHYAERLGPVAERYGIQLPTVPSHCEQPYHMFYLILRDQELRARLISHLKDRGILSVFHYLPLHLSPMGRAFGGSAGDCPVTERVSDCLLRLPFFNNLTTDEQDDICDCVEEALRDS